MGIGDVAGDGKTLAAGIVDFSGDFGERIGAAAEDGGARAFFCEEKSDGAADAGAATGDERDFVGEAGHEGALYLFEGKKKGGTWCKGKGIVGHKEFTRWKEGGGLKS